MPSNINYSITSNDKGSVVVRSTVKSFNLDHVTDKDLVSFYRNLSSYAMFDTGLMPLSGTGVLAIRSAGNHTQITFQHAPQINHINWGATEGDPGAKTYTVAQPYRIWIGDLIDGNFYGARMFYSPYPITSPDQPLYHINLPNTNCKGYRGNGVGWQCLYHSQDWSSLPFNEKIARFAERCSGVEAYNDANMSETDGPRFYKENDMPEYTWNPVAWQNKTTNEGLDWVYNTENWIPILVRDQDNQDMHYYDGQPLTIQMAMLGNYQAYYTDSYRPKPINILSRSDLTLDPNKVVGWLSIIHNSSSLQDTATNLMEESLKVRSNFNTSVNKAIIGGFDIDDSIGQEEDEDDEEDTEMMAIICPLTGSICHVHQDDYYTDDYQNKYCEPCFSENVVYCENTNTHLPSDDDKVLFIESQGIYINKDKAIIDTCSNCEAQYWSSTDPKNSSAISQVYESSNKEDFCSACLPEYVSENIDSETNTIKVFDNEYKVAYCYGCSTVVLDSPEWSHVFYSPKVINVLYSEEIDKTECFVSHDIFCPSCASRYALCPTGHYVLPWNNPLVKLPHEYKISVHDKLSDKTIETSLTHLCSGCINPDIINNKEDIDPVTLIDPFNPLSETKQRYELSVLNNIAFTTSVCTNLTNPEAPF